MKKLIGLALVCSVLFACSGSVTVMPEDESLGTTTTSSGTAPTTQPPDTDGGSGDAGGGDVVGGAGGEGGVGTDGGAPEGGSPPNDCSTNALSVKLDSNTPQSAIVIGGSDWTEVARYVVTNSTDKAIKISYAEVTQMDPNGDVADFTEVALSTNYALHLIGSKVNEYGISFVLTEEKSGGLVISPAESVSVEVAAKISPVLSSSAAGGKWYSVPRSGHTPALSFERYRIEGEAENVTHKTCATKPSSMVVRKSKPIVTKLALPTNTLSNADVDLFQFQVKADNAGPIAVRQITFRFEKIGGFNVSNLRIRRNGQDMPISDYVIEVCPDKVGGCWDTLGGNFESGTVFVVWHYEQVISGSGNVFTLHGVVSEAEKGSSIDLGLLHTDPSWSPSIAVTGKIATDTGFFFIAKDEEPIMANPVATPYFLWSDLSEVPHSGGTAGLLDSSADWTTDLLVEDLSGSETLSL
jgi:hypothetical protein